MGIKERIAAANDEAVRRLVSAEPTLVAIAPAGEVVPGLTGRMLLHSGPPITWQRMCGAQRGAAIGAALFEGWAESPAEAETLLEGGAIRLAPDHEHQAVGPMAGITSPSMPVFVVENTALGNRAFCRQIDNQHQFGAYGPEALDGLRQWRDVWAPALRRAIAHGGPVALKPIIAKALQMGDELHNRHAAASALFASAMALAIIEAGVPKDATTETLRWLSGQERSFLALVMASAKAAADAASGVEYCTVVTAMARNGTDFGIRVSGLGGQWFTAPAPEIKGLYLPGFGPRDAGRDMGDSAIAETVGLGAFVLVGAPGILPLLGGTLDEALDYDRAMREITVGQHPVYRVPALGFAGAPVGIDIRKVVQTGQPPVIDTAIAHREPGHGIIGAGLVRAPMECFKQALVGFARQYGVG